MELSGPQIITALASLFGTFSTVVAFLYRQASKSKDDLIASKDKQIIDLLKTIDYERNEKSQERARLDGLFTEFRDAVKDMASGVEQIGPIVSTDGSMTREHVRRTGSKTIRALGGQAEDD